MIKDGKVTHGLEDWNILAIHLQQRQRML